MSVTADSTLWTADTHCVTADGRIVCIEAELHEAAGALDSLDAANVVSAVLIEAAAAFDALDAVTDVAAAVLEAATAVDETDAAVGAKVCFGTVDEAADARERRSMRLSMLLASRRWRRWLLLSAAAAVAGRRPSATASCRSSRAKPTASLALSALVPGHFPAWWARRQDRPALLGAAPQSSGLSVRSAIGAGGTRGAGAGVIVKFSGSATGRHDDDEAAVIAFLLAA